LLTEESIVIACPNPNCRKEIKEPMLLKILCVTPPEQYEACPYCFAKLQLKEHPQKSEVSELELNQEETDLEELEQKEDIHAEESPNVYEEDEIEEILPERDVVKKVKESHVSFLQKVKSLIPTGNGSKKDETDSKPEVKVKPEEVFDENEDLYENEDVDDDFENDKSDGEEKTEIKMEPKSPESVKTEKEQSGCPEFFGYLANREKDVPIPSVCYVCPKMVDCMLSPKNE
jgi:hypothetical protein